MERDILNRDSRLAKESLEAARTQDAQERETYRKENFGVTPYDSATQDSSLEDKAYKLKVAKERKVKKLKATQRPSIEGGFDFSDSNYSKVEPTLDRASTATGVPKDILAGVVAEETGFQGGSDDVKRTAIRLKRAHRDLLSNGVAEDTVWNEAVKSINPDNPEFESNVMKNIANLQHSLNPEDMYSIGAGGINIRDDNPYLGINSGLRREEELSSVPEGAREVQVSRVKDGDTVELTNGETIRFRNIDTPELDSANNYEGLEDGAVQATNWLETAIEASDGKLFLTTDLEGNQRVYDKYDRLLDSPILKDGTSSERMLRDEDLADSYRGRVSANHMYETPFEVGEGSSDGYRAGLGYDIYASSPEAVRQGFAGMTTSGDIDNPTRGRDNDLTSQQAQAFTGTLLGKYSLNEEGTAFTDGKEYEGNAARVVLGTDSQGNQTLRIGPKNDNSLAEDIEVSYNELLPENAALMLRDTLYGRKEARENRAATLESEVAGETSYGERYDEYFVGDSLLGNGQLEENEPTITNEFVEEELINQRIREYQYNNRDGGILYEKGLEMDIDRAEDKIESDNAGGWQIAGNTFNAALARITNIALDAYNVPANQFEEKTGLNVTAGDTPEETTSIANNALNYNPVRAEEAMQKIEPYAEGILEAITEDGKKLASKDLYGAIKTVVETPELAFQSVGDIAWLVSGKTIGSFVKVAFGKGKLIKKQEEVKKLEKQFKDGSISRDQAREGIAAIENTSLSGKLLKRVADEEGLITYVGGSVATQIEDFKSENNGVAPTEADVARMLTIGTVSAVLDRGVGLALFKDKGYIKKIKNALTVVPESTKMKMVAAVPKKAAAISLAAGAEAGQEYLQTMGEIFNTEFNTWKGGNDAVAIVTDKDNQIEATSGALVGATVGGEFKGVSEVVIPSVQELMRGTGEAKKSLGKAFPTRETKQARGADRDLSYAREQARKSREEEVKANEAVYNEFNQTFSEEVGTSNEDLTSYLQENNPNVAVEGLTNEELFTEAVFTYIGQDVNPVINGEVELTSGQLEEPVRNMVQLAEGFRLKGDETTAKAIRSKSLILNKRLLEAQRREETNNTANVYGSSEEFTKYITGLGKSDVDVSDSDIDTLIELGKGYGSIELSNKNIRDLIGLGQTEVAVEASEMSSTGKSVSDVSKEALDEARGFITYYKDAVNAKINRNNEKYQAAVRNIQNFTDLQQTKITRLQEGLKNVQVGVQKEILSKAIEIATERNENTSSENITPEDITPEIEAEAIRSVVDKYDRNNYAKGTQPNDHFVTVDYPSKKGSFRISKYEAATGKGGIFKVLEEVRKEYEAGKNLQTLLEDNEASLSPKDVLPGSKKFEERNLDRAETGPTASPESEINFSTVPTEEPTIATPPDDRETSTSETTADYTAPDSYMSDEEADALSALASEYEATMEDPETFYVEEDFGDNTATAPQDSKKTVTRKAVEARGKVKQIREDIRGKKERIQKIQKTLSDILDRSVSKRDIESMLSKNPAYVTTPALKTLDNIEKMLSTDTGNNRTKKSEMSPDQKSKYDSLVNKIRTSLEGC